LKGFPPADAVLHAWLSSLKGSNNQDMVAMNLHGFLSSLFSVTRKHLETLDQPDDMAVEVLSWDEIRNLPDRKQRELVEHYEKRRETLAAAFHNRMTDEQDFEAPNKYRQMFFKEVVDKANEVSF
jgi:uncharacterized protein (UPF0305 family)